MILPFGFTLTNIYCFPRRHRLLKRKNFQFVLEKAEIKSINDHFVLLARLNELDYSRVGFIISKKSFPLAVDRNLIKRLMRETFRQNQHKFVGIDIVVISRKGQKCRVSDEIRKKLVTLWKVLKKRYKKFASR